MTPPRCRRRGYWTGSCRGRGGAAGRLGKEAAVLMPSGTMANLAAVLSWTRPADEVVLEAEAHLLYYEAGGISGVAGCVPLGGPGGRGGLRAAGGAGGPRRPA